MYATAMMAYLGFQNYTIEQCMQVKEYKARKTNEGDSASWRANAGVLSYLSWKQMLERNYMQMRECVQVQCLFRWQSICRWERVYR